MPECRSILPAPLRPGDTVAILSPASAVDTAFIDGAEARLAALGYKPRVMPHARGRHGSYAAPAADRLADLLAALTDPEVRAIVCSRGGYGCVHLLPHIPPGLVAANPKWLVGFSDISALHALWLHAGVVSLHASMTRHLAGAPDGDPALTALLDILTGASAPQYTVAPHPLNRTGSAEGRLAGGNLAVLNSLAATPYDILPPPGHGADTIFFIEDVSEAIYAVERMLLRMAMAGAFSRAAGVVFGRFTEYRPDANFADMEAMIAARILPLIPAGVPVALHFPTGHIGHANLPLPSGAPARLTVTPADTTLAISGL